MDNKIKIPVCRPSVSERERFWLNKALDENRISSRGGLTELFEKEFAKKIGMKHCVAVNSGGSSLFLTLWALGIRSGDEVIVPDYTFVATANCVLQCEANPIFVDIEPDTGNIDVSKIEEKITYRTRAIIPVHIYGHPCEMDKILDLATKYHLHVVEDAAEAHGALYKGKPVGSLGDVNCFSFFGNKVITTGDGGAVCTNNDKLTEEIRALRAYCQEDGYFHPKLGWSMEMSSLQAAFGLGQLDRWNKLIEGRRKNAVYYSKHLSDLVEIPTEKDYAFSVFWMYWIKTDRKEELAEFLRKKGIETKPAFYPLHRQPFLREKKKYPVTDRFAKRVLCLPSSSDLTKKEQDYVIKAIKEFYGK